MTKTKTKTVLILGNDQHAWAMHYYLLGKGQPSYVLDSRSDWKMVDGRGLTLLANGKRLNFETIQSVYWRSHDGVAVPEGASEFALHNRASIFDSYLKMLELRGVPFYNGYQAWQLHKTKPYQNKVLEDLLDDRQEYPDLMLPSTSYASVDNYTDDICNDVSELLGYAVKGCQGGIHTIRFGDEPWPSDVYSCFQDLIKGTTLRCYAFSGGDCVTYRVEADTLDYRSDPNPRITLVDIAKDTVLQLCNMVNQIGWSWAGIDVIKSHEGGKNYVLDVNPAPMFIGFDGGKEVFEALSHELMRD